jgi:hypothetical protein
MLVVEIGRIELWQLWTGNPQAPTLKLSGPTRRVTPGRLVVVAATADGVSHPSHHHQQQADDEEDDPDDQANMGVGEGRDEGREEEPEDDKEDSEADHDVYLVSVWMFGGGFARVSD